MATPKARNLLLSFLASPHRKERWASAIALGRLKEERVFFLLQDLLLEGLGFLQGKAPDVFWQVEGVFHRFPWFWQQEASPLVEAEQVQRLLAQRFGLSRVEQEQYVQQFPGACRERSQRVKGTHGEHCAAFDPFEEWDNDLEWL